MGKGCHPALGCRKLEQIPWNLFPQIGQQCWLASTDNSGCLQYLQYFTMLRWYYVIIEGIECSQMLGQFDASIQVGQFQNASFFLFFCDDNNDGHFDKRLFSHKKWHY